MMELLVIAGVVVLLFGASGAKKMLATARSVRDAKRDITSGAVLKRLVDDPPKDPPKDSSNSKSS